MAQHLIYYCLSDETSLVLSFLICKMEIIKIPILEGSCEVWNNSGLLLSGRFLLVLTKISFIISYWVHTMCQGICIAAFITFKSASFFRISTSVYHRCHLVPFKKKKVESNEKSTSKQRIYFIYKWYLKFYFQQQLR